MVAASSSFIVVVSLLILISSSYRRCCPSLTSRRRTAAGAAIQSISAGVAQPRLVGFTTANRHLDKTFAWTRTRDGGRQIAEHHHDRRETQTEHTEPMTTARVKSPYNHQRQTDDDRLSPPVVSSCLTTRSLSVPAITDSSADDRTADHRRRAAADRSARMTTAVVSARVDSGVSGMQSSACTLSSSTTQLQQTSNSDVEAQSADRVDTAIGSPPVWSLSQMSMDVHSCPGGATLLPPLLLCQYVNGYSDAMLMHVADRQRSSWHSGESSHAASTTATDADGADPESRRCGESVPQDSRGALTVRTQAIVEPRRTVGEHGDTDTPCVCGQSHDVPPTHRPDLPPPPSDATPDSTPSTTDPCDLPPPLHLPPLPTSVHCQPLHPSPSAPECDTARPRPYVKSLDTVVHAVTLSSPAEVDRRRFLTRLLLGRHEELALSPVYCEETYF